MNRKTHIAILTTAAALMARADDSAQRTGANPPDAVVKQGSLQCSEKLLTTAYSFEKAKAASKKREADIIFYFDDDDCSQGALFGQDDRKGFIFPVGKKSWDEVSLRDLPREDTESVVGFRPITKNKEGLAFWVKTKGERYVLVRIKSVQPASYAELTSGKTAKVDFEWAWGVPGGE